VAVSQLEFCLQPNKRHPWLFEANDSAKKNKPVAKVKITLSRLYAALHPKTYHRSAKKNGVYGHYFSLWQHPTFG